ncbi:type 1 glutamine amidotransferase [Desulfonema ishimotonii]|uniref:Type 1 glutamine amidotransferase n=1 Tax=Desulfonema ishimotonii TaxID=45657 RepID=A0A401G1Y0_9BACT|nr:type 1 glutamine amidotransferase [Desulfonema ishimotonii]
MARLLVMDNYDSFTYNLVQMFRQYPLEIRVCRSDKITPDQAAALRPDYILISPGPRDPVHAGNSIPMIKAFYRDIPVLGVCLGMQCINEVFGGKTVRAPLPMHGKTSQVRHEGGGVFDTLPSPFTVARYHSLAVQPNGTDALRVTARSEDRVIMGISHKKYPLHGVQFHPESFLTEGGFALIENFLRLGPLREDIDASGN